MPRRLNDSIVARQAIAPTVTSGALTGIAVNGTGYSRARFVFQFGSGSGTTAALAAGSAAWQCATSGGTYTPITGADLAAVSSGVMSGANNVMIVDVPISPSYPWLKASATVNSSIINNSCVVELYNGVNRPASTPEQQAVVV